MAIKFTKLKPSSPNSNKGFTLVELLVTTLIASVVLGLSLGLITDQRKQFVSDQVRSQSNQTLRVGMDMVGTDIKNTGDFLQSDINLPVVTVINGTSGGSDQLILQRKLIADSLTVCENVNAGSKTTIKVAIKPGNTDCPVYSDGDGDNLTDALTLAQRERCEQDNTEGCSRTSGPPATGTCDNECVWAYIYDPVHQEGEFFQYSFEEPDSTTNPTFNQIHVGGAATFTNTYEVANKPVIYLIEKRHYSLNNNVLQLSVNDQPALLLVNQVEDFQVQAKLTNNTSLQTSFNDTASANEASTYVQTTDWQSLEYLQVDVESVDPSESELTAVKNADQLKLSSRFFPRNALSQD
ncbi:MAG: prepilin-type N-terminal cleavage/methylation domain-containing protein [Acaryochloris sp. RU_4_1]|nr:prepilin-type N-terminal cleavage/methylation domain-containing protein [Acaryochloris sp. RU_4_1]NJR56717.1 prepilin-type N-terminal cleavage/methylation domain-containing protein [Acaryochloris sp. CRU_2_0]